MTHIITNDDIKELRDAGYEQDSMLFGSSREQKYAYMVSDPFGPIIYFKLVHKGEIIHTCNDIYELVSEYNMVTK